MEKIHLLSELKVFVDRLSTTNYLTPRQIDELVAKFGEKPSVLTWGDYFQSETAQDHFDKTDGEFQRIVETIQFDILAAIMIYQNKDQGFFDTIENEYQKSLQKSEHDWTLQDEEYIHLGLLKSYYFHLGLENSVLSSEDHGWFKQFEMALAI